jgi:hypothetical protein
MDPTGMSPETQRADPVPEPATGVSWLALFTSLGTLVCCALPIVLVTLGLGAAVAALTSAFPFLITLSQHKGWVFAVSGLLLAFGAWLTWGPRGRRCPADPTQAAACARARRWNRRILGASIAVWLVGAFAAFALYPLARWWDNL